MDESSPELSQVALEAADPTTSFTQAAENTVQTASTLPRRSLLAGILGGAASLFGFGREVPTVVAPTVKPVRLNVPVIQIQQGKRIERSEEVSKTNSQEGIKLSVPQALKTELEAKFSEQEEATRRKAREFGDFRKSLFSLIKPEAFEKYYPELAQEIRDPARIEQAYAFFTVKTLEADGKKQTTLRLINPKNQEEVVTLVVDTSSLQTRQLELTPSKLAINSDEALKVAKELTGFGSISSDAKIAGLYTSSTTEEGLQKKIGVNDQGFIRLEEKEIPLSS